MKIFKTIKSKITALIVSVAILLSGQVFLPTNFFNASAATLSYSNVLDDLRISENFDETKYPEVDSDYSVKLITIAESDYNELFLYVYQPSAKKSQFTCVKVSIHLGFSPDGQNLNPDLYNLKLVSNNGVFYKYVVEDFVPIKEEETHYFNIVSLYRNANSLLEESISGGTTDSKAFPVGEQWCCYADNGVMHYEKATFKTVEMNPLMNGSTNLKEGTLLKDFLGFKSGQKVLFLAFNVDNYNIEHIYDANLSYEYRYVKYTSIDSSFDLSGQYPIVFYKYSEDGINYNDDNKFYSKPVKLNEKDSFSYQGKGLLSKKYTWKSIYSTEEFLKEYSEQDIEFKGGTYNTLKQSQFIFCYADYEYNNGSNSDTSQGMPTITYTTTWKSYAEYKSVTVLTLHFLDAKKGELNLGVVCDITTADNIDDAVGNGLDLEKVEDLLIKILAVLALVLILYLIWPFISPIIMIIFKLLSKLNSMILKLFALIFKFIWSILTFPFRLLKPK